MHHDSNARSGDRLPEISNSPANNAQLTDLIRRLDALEGLAELLWERQREERERWFDPSEDL
jgi:hypothetical protein